MLTTIALFVIKCGGSVHTEKGILTEITNQTRFLPKGLEFTLLNIKK